MIAYLTDLTIEIDLQPQLWKIEEAAKVILLISIARDKFPNKDEIVLVADSPANSFLVNMDILEASLIDAGDYVSIREDFNYITTQKWLAKIYNGTL